MRCVALTIFVLTGCASAVPPPPPHVAVAAPAVAHPEASASDLPLSIRRLVAEEQREMQDVLTLAGPVGDERGRARVSREVNALADELRAVESGLRTPELDSDELDHLVTRLHQLAARVDLLHDALRVASGPRSAVELEPR